jgi:hypothetical protein
VLFYFAFYSVHLGVSSLVLAFLVAWLLRTRPKHIESVSHGEAMTLKMRRMQRQMQRWRVRRDFLVSMFWRGTVQQLFWVLFFVRALPDSLTVEKFARILTMFIIEGCLLNLTWYSRFATLGHVLASNRPAERWLDDLAPCLLRVVSHYSWALQSVLIPILGLVVGSTDSVSDIIVNCVLATYALLFLAMTPVFAYLSSRLQRSTHRPKTQNHRLGMVATTIICLLQGSWCCLALVRSGSDAKELDRRVKGKEINIVDSILMVAVFCATMTWSFVLFCPCLCSRGAKKASTGSSIAAAACCRAIQGPGPASPGPGLATGVSVEEFHRTLPPQLRPLSSPLSPDHDWMLQVLLTQPISFPKATPETAEEVPDSGGLLEYLGGPEMLNPTLEMVDAEHLAHTSRSRARSHRFIPMSCVARKLFQSRS